MGYAVHIEKHENGRLIPIAIEDWLAAVEAVDGVQLADGVVEREVPREVGSTMRMGARVGDAAVFFSDGEAWHTTFFWSPRGRATCHVARGFEEEDAVRIAARSLAERLGAVVVGDEGERYN